MNMLLLNMENYMWTFNYWLAIALIILSVFGIIGMSMILTLYCEKLAQKKWAKQHVPIKQTRLYKNLKRECDE